MLPWPSLTRLRVVFGHQSVGGNILMGIERLAAQDGVGIAIRERRDAPALPGINHFLIGRNGDPLAKIRDFAAALDAGIAQEADIALMKLCYADFAAATDARRVAEAYMSSLAALVQRHPETHFIAVTAPLLAPPRGPRAWLKRLLGRRRAWQEAQARRTEFNALLRQHYPTAGRLFDLARLEAAADEVDDVGDAVEALRPELTSDGGHLNERGQELVAGALLNFIGAIASVRAAEAVELAPTAASPAWVIAPDPPPVSPAA